MKMKEILIIDDNIEILDIYQQILEEEFPELIIQRYDCAFEAIQYLKMKKPILIVCDYYMPKLNGCRIS
jgi:CheY-like chemotaxis protein